MLKRKILLVTQNLRRQGAQLSLYYLARNFARKGYDVEIITMGGGELLEKYMEEKINVYNYRLPGEIISKVIFMLKLHWFFYRKEYDLIFINTITMHYFLKILTLDKKKCIWCIRESEREYWFRNLNKIGKIDKLFNKPKKVLFVSNKTREIYEDLNKNDNFYVIHNGIDLREIEEFKNSYSKEEIKRSLNLEDSQIYLNVGTIVPRKGQKTIVDAAIKFIKEKNDRNICFFLVGGTNFSNYEYDIRKTISNNNLVTQIYVLPEISDIFKFYRMADYFIFTSIYESLPRTIMEAMAFELPIISTDVFGVVEEVEDGKSALIIKQNDSDALLEKLHYLDNNPEVAKKLGQEAYRRVNKYFCLERMVNDYEGLFEECIR